VQGGEFRFRLFYSNVSGGSTTYCSDCPTITIGIGDVVGTTNGTAQQALETMIVPQRTLRGGVRHQAGSVWQQELAAPMTVDLDAILV
jgi:hypothetical protein